MNDVFKSTPTEDFLDKALTPFGKQFFIEQTTSSYKVDGNFDPRWDIRIGVVFRISEEEFMNFQSKLREDFEKTDEVKLVEKLLEEKYGVED